MDVWIETNFDNSFDLNLWSDTPQNGLYGSYLIREIALPTIESISSEGLVTVNFHKPIIYKKNEWPL